MLLPDSSILTNISVPGPTRPDDRLLERKYVTISTMEGRMYSDEELIQLPEIARSHPHYREWQCRKASMRRLIHWLGSRKRSLNILEIGCGNGWLSHHLSEIPGAKVIGLDIYFTELQQAARVFSDQPNLRFIQGDIRAGVVSHLAFDAIIFAASIQYFPSLRKILHATLAHLNPYGEVHILDTPFFRPAEIIREKMKVAAYYSSLGFPEMADCYHHHSLDAFSSFHHKILYNPDSVVCRLLNSKSAYPWICVRTPEGLV